MKLKVAFTSDSARILYSRRPLQYQTHGSAGFDLMAHAIHSGGVDYNIEDPFILHPNQRILIKTGLAFGIEEGYEVQIRSRSGLALKNGVMVLNSPGTIDSDYRGEIGVVLLNTDSFKNFQIAFGDRICQAVVSKLDICQFDLVSIDDLEETDRSSGGFGSTGI
jgi:dUTP pyrophosphatase